MRLFSLFALCLLLALAGSAAEFSVATYNVHNYSEVDRMTEGGFEMKAPKPESEKAALRKVIRTLNADVLVMQEMGSAAHLRELQRDLAREGLNYPYSGWVAGQDPDRHVAFLSRIKPLAFVSHDDLPTRWKPGSRVRRGLLEARFPFGKSELTVYAMHLKSQRTSDPADPEAKGERRREAEAVRDFVLKAHPEGDDFYLLAGDFNDTRRSKTLNALTKRGKRVIAQRVEARDSDGMVWTHRYSREGVYSNLDYILASPALFPLVKGQGVILDIPETADASDHRPVRVTFQVPAAAAGAKARPSGTSQEPAGGSVDDVDGGVPEVAPAGDNASED
ncbi:endonuclease/exonuclease/phosphatase family protein [Nibricoccus sp. IMCC34717]|uniref:endonuclease/exonuclease/phosphatase family protein n=1 Tax=Nibricoccus sp. IMCC34717 TaxID=3034021 RepID=UPI00384E3367